MIYNVIGLMSGSSLDGIDICYTTISLISGNKWEYEIKEADCVPYPRDLKIKLKTAANLSVPDFLRLNTDFARFCAENVKKFIAEHDLDHKIFFIASHGHTVWHEPETGVSTQIGDGATIAALTGFSTITDLRNMDVALGGQGAPIVPIADRLLFSEYNFCLNLGGIANITVNKENPIAFDICPANQVLDYLARKKGLDFDENGEIAKSGQANKKILEIINAEEYYHRDPPKSLSNSFSEKKIIKPLDKDSTENAAATAVEHIATQICNAIAPYCQRTEEYKMLITGGGAFNNFMVEQIKAKLTESSIPVTCIVPDDKLIQYKEALAMALMGILRWREEANVFASVSGASRNSIGGAFWMGNT